MDYNCDVPFYVGPLFLVFGCVALTMGALAWHFPLPRRYKVFLTHIAEGAAPDSRGQRVWKILGPINGTVFIVVGAYTVWGTLLCRHVNLGIPDVHGPFAFTWWSGIYPAIAISTAIGIYNARTYHSWATRGILILAAFGFGLAGGEAAGFHVGIHAAQWGVIAVSCWLIIGATFVIDILVQKRQHGSA